MSNHRKYAIMKCNIKEVNMSEESPTFEQYELAHAEWDLYDAGNETPPRPIETISPESTYSQEDLDALWAQDVFAEAREITDELERVKEFHLSAMQYALAEKWQEDKRAGEITQKDLDKAVVDHALELAELAYKNTVTGLPNRRAFERDLEKLETARPYGILLVDLDDFKTVNDLLSHADGDTVLRAVGSHLHEIFRIHHNERRALQTDDQVERRKIDRRKYPDVVDKILKVYHLSGDEFAVIFDLDSIRKWEDRDIINYFQILISHLNNPDIRLDVTSGENRIEMSMSVAGNVTFPGFDDPYKDGEIVRQIDERLSDEKRYHQEERKQVDEDGNPLRRGTTIRSSLSLGEGIISALQARRGR